MDIQYLSDNLGNKTAVVIPIRDWQNITKKFGHIISSFETANSTPITNNSVISETELNQEVFLNWIEKAEKSPKMSLESFNIKWEKKKAEIQKLIL